MSATIIRDVDILVTMAILIKIILDAHVAAHERRHRILYIYRYIIFQLTAQKKGPKMYYKRQLRGKRGAARCTVRVPLT